MNERRDRQTLCIRFTIETREVQGFTKLKYYYIKTLGCHWRTKSFSVSTIYSEGSKFGNIIDDR